MNPLDILMQFSANAEVPLFKLVIFWAGVVICVVAFFYFLHRTDRLIQQREQTEQVSKAAEKKPVRFDDVHDEEAAAIALAIHLYKSQMHDMESMNITLNKVSRIYSPWSSKIYTLRQNPRFK